MDILYCRLKTVLLVSATERNLTHLHSPKTNVVVSVCSRVDGSVLENDASAKREICDMQHLSLCKNKVCMFENVL